MLYVNRKARTARFSSYTEILIRYDKPFKNQNIDDNQPAPLIFNLKIRVFFLWVPLYIPVHYEGG